MRSGRAEGQPEREQVGSQAIRPFPISWQDTGSGVFTLAGAAVGLAAGAARGDPAGRANRLALWTALAALMVDVYLY